MHQLPSMNCQPFSVAAAGVVSSLGATAYEYKAARGLPARMWVQVELGAKPRYFAVPDKHVRSEAAPIKGFDLLQLRVAGVCVEVVAEALGDDQHSALEDIPASHAFALASEGVACSRAPCPEGSPETAWFCFALPTAVGGGA